MMSECLHQPVLLHEAITGLNIQKQGGYVDATFGRGGHSRAILAGLDARGQLFAFDKDPAAIAYGQKQFADDPRIKLFHRSFAELADVIKANDMVGSVLGVLLDLGVSSVQLDDSTRGFSFMHNGPLDMRMDPTSGLTVEKWLASAEEKTIADVLWQYGEETESRRIARAIVHDREIEPIQSTEQLANLIARVKRKKPKRIHPATQAFQALRIMINDELQDLARALQQCLEVLAIGGRLVVISFHSLEDRIVKRFIKAQQFANVLPREIPVDLTEFTPRLRLIEKAIKPSPEEKQTNPRARSAILRIAEKIA